MEKETIYPYTRKATFDGCHPDILKAILAGEEIFCSVIDSDDGTSNFGWVIGFSAAEEVEEGTQRRHYYYGHWRTWIHAVPVRATLTVEGEGLPMMDMDHYKKTGELIPYEEELA